MPCANNYGIIKWSGMMDWVIAVGAAALGGILGRIGWEAFERRSTTFTAKAASAIVSVMVGPAVAGIFQAIAGTKSASRGKCGFIRSVFCSAPSFAQTAQFAKPVEAATMMTNVADQLLKGEIHRTPSIMGCLARQSRKGLNAEWKTISSGPGGKRQQPRLESDCTKILAGLTKTMRGPPSCGL
jgi:hypothetical protein